MKRKRKGKEEVGKRRGEEITEDGQFRGINMRDWFKTECCCEHRSYPRQREPYRLSKHYITAVSAQPASGQPTSLEVAAIKFDLTKMKM